LAKYFVTDKSSCLTSFSELRLLQVKSILSELAKFHATGFHHLQNYEPNGPEAFMRDFPGASCNLNYPFKNNYQQKIRI